MARVLLRGRSEPMRTALATLRSVWRQGHGAVLMITGEAGIGKTALLGTVVAEAVSLKFAPGVGKAEPIGPISPGAPLLLALRSGAHPLLPSSVLAELQELTDQPVLLLDALAEHLERRAVTAPIVLAVDNANRIDPLSRFLLRSLPTRLTGSPVLWIFAGRPAQDCLASNLSELRSDELPVSQIHLGPLATADIAAIAQDRLGRVPDGANRRLLERVSGNPLLAMQIIDGISQSPSPGQAPGEIPTELLLGIRRQLAQLAPATADLIRATAVFGQPFTIADTVALLPDRSADEMAQVIDEAIRAGLLTIRQGRHEFRYDLIRETIYGDLNESLCKSVHGRSARHLRSGGAAGVDVVGHARAALRDGDEASALLLADVAAEIVMVLPETAGDLILQAFHTLGPAHPSWVELGERAMAILGTVRRCDESAAVANLVLAQVDDAESIGRIEVALARALWLRGDLEASATRSRWALRHEGLSPQLHARLTSLHALARSRITQPESAVVVAREALAGAEAASDRTAKVVAMHALAEVTQKTGDHRGALTWFRRLRAQGEQVFLDQEILTLQHLDRYQDAATLLEQARRQAGDVHQNLLPSLQSAHVWQDFDLGRLDQAETAGRGLFALGRRLRNRMCSLETVTVLSGIALLRGDVGEAAAWISDRIDSCTAEDENLVPVLVLQQGWLAASAGAPERAVELARPLLRDVSLGQHVWPWTPGWMRTLTRWGMADGSLDFVEEAVTLAEAGADRNPGVASFEGVALQVRGILTRDLDLLAQAADVLSRSPRPLLQASGYEDFGRALLSSGNRSEAVASLDRALEIYRRLGANGPGAALRQEMAAAGVRRKVLPGSEGKPRSGWEALTPTEIKVAHLIGSGHTNKQTADELSVSANTVGTHVRSVFAKLGVRSRVQLANLMRDESPFARQG